MEKPGKPTCCDEAKDAVEARAMAACWRALGWAPRIIRTRVALWVVAVHP